MRGISWLAANQLAAQEGLCTVEWVSKYVPEGREENEAHRQDGQRPIFEGQAVALLLKMGRRGYPETSARKYRSTLRTVTDERKSHLLRDASLKSRKRNLICRQVKIMLRKIICDVSSVCRVGCNPILTQIN